MAISNELMLAILAMDAYNRGYNAGIKSDGAGEREGLTGGQIGTATVGIRSNNNANSPDVAASFFAQSYTYNGQTVISYRGTDKPLDDFFTGWVGALGFNTPQASLAQDFFKTVVQGNATSPTDYDALRNGQSTIRNHLR